MPYPVVITPITPQATTGTLNGGSNTVYLFVMMNVL